MASVVNTYSPDKVVIIIGGFHMHGYGEDTFLNISYLTDGVVSRVGADGEIARAVSTNKMTRVTLTLGQ
ncbi:hypothetical protein, partial [Pseudomonas aeruginosa]|uniref:hypothetical protein n=1 Tax=Pseudomonas aeruginosa TaxID=287 RepID=UPI003002C11C